MKTAIYPGSFDPITLGHLNIIKRAAAMFEQVIVCVMANSEKHGLFSREERVEMISRVIGDVPNVVVDSFKGLVADYAQRHNINVVVKGLRAISDYEKEVQMAIVNQKLYTRLDTIFLPSSEKYTYLSSSVVKEMARYGVDLSDLVPREIIDDVTMRVRDTIAE